MKNLFFACVCFSLIMYSGMLHGEIIAQHEGANNPVLTDTTTWAKDSSGSVVVGAVIDDQGSGYDAWSINDSTLTGEWSYIYSFKPEETSKIQTQPWILSTRLRVVNDGDECDAGIAVRIANGSKRWQANFGSAADGDPIVRLVLSSGSTLTLDLDGIGSGYHLYEWKKTDPSDDKVNFYVDGVEKYAGWSGYNHTSKYVAWGSGNYAGYGRANYNLVRLAVVPEPGVIVLILGGFLCLLVSRVRAGKKP